MSKEEYKGAIEVSVIFHEGQRMFAVPKQVAQQQEPTKAAELVDALIAKYSDKLYDSVGPHDAAKFEEDCKHLKQALAEPAQQEPCGGCGGSGWVTRDPDIGTDQECFVCEGKGTIETEQPAQQCKWPTCQSEEYQKSLAEQIKRELVGEQPAQRKPPAWWPAVENILKEYGLQAIDFVADFKAAMAEQPAQRTWVGLEKSDMPDGADPLFDDPKFIAGMVYAANKLMEKNA
jgi:hypothetical protein